MKKFAALTAVAMLAMVTGCGNKAKTASAGSESLAPVAPPPPVHSTATPSPVTPVTYDAVPTTETPAAGGGKLTAGSKYTVQKGDTLWNIAQRTYGDGKQYKKIVAANPSIKGDRVNVGQTITLP